MTEDPAGTTNASAVASVDLVQLAVVSLCIVALVVAAFLAPPPVSPPDPGTDQPDQPDERNERTGGGGSDGGGDDSTGGGRVIGDGGRPIPVPGDSPPADVDGCGVVLEDEPVPGTRVTVSVYVDLQPATDVPVQFNGEVIGRTGPGGSVTAPVPYQRELNVSVDVPGVEHCEFYRRQFDDGPGADGSGRRGGDRDETKSAVSGAVEPAGPLLSGVTVASVSGRVDAAGTAQEQSGTAQETNFTTTYRVHGAMNLTVVGQPRAGATVTLRARIEGNPVPDARVEIDGQTAGRTGADGEYDLTVPEEDRVTVTVARGEFSQSTTIDVVYMDVSIDPQEGLPVPGEPALVTATVDGEPVSDGVVVVDGQRVGRATPNGTATVELPANPAATVEVRSEYLTGSAAFWPIYAVTAVGWLFIGAAAVVTTAVGRRLSGPWGVRRLVPVWGAVGAAYATATVDEWRLFGAVALLSLLVTLYFGRRRVASGGAAAAGLFTRFVDWARRAAWWVTAGVERLLAGAVALAGRRWAWFRGVPARVRAAGEHVTARRAGVGVVAVALVAGLTYQYEVGGFVAAVAVIGVGAVVQWWRTREPSGGAATGDEPDASPQAVGAATGGGSGSRLSLREMWRRFARWVVPGRWRTRTPAEVSRAAVDRGFPREPVEALTEAFREAEYGDGAPQSRRERAREAFRRLANRDRGDDR